MTGDDLLAAIEKGVDCSNPSVDQTCSDPSVDLQLMTRVGRPSPKRCRCSAGEICRL